MNNSRDKYELYESKDDNSHDSDIELKHFLFSQKDLRRSFFRIILLFVWISIMSYQNDSFDKDVFLFYLIIFTPFMLSEHIIDIFRWVFLRIKIRPEGEMSEDFNTAKIFFKEQVAVGKKYLFLREPHKILLLEDGHRRQDRRFRQGVRTCPRHRPEER